MYRITNELNLEGVACLVECEVYKGIYNTETNFFFFFL